MNVTLLRAHRNQHLAKLWGADGAIEPAANAAWFKAAEIPIESVDDFRAILAAVEGKPSIALVKEAIAPGADPKRLRRRCEAGVDRYTDEAYPAGLQVAQRQWLPLDIEGVPRPAAIDYRDGDALAAHVRALLPEEFRNSACVWQFSGSSGHPSMRNDVRLHLFFRCNKLVFPEAWKRNFSGLPFVDPSAFDKAKLIFTAAPIIQNGMDPISQRHGLLKGEVVVRVPAAVATRSAQIARGDHVAKRSRRIVVGAPMPEAAAAFVELIAKSSILRSQHPTYSNERGRRLAFCTMLKTDFGIEDKTTLEAAFYKACVGDDDPHAEHDAQQALEWTERPSASGRCFSVRKLLCDAAAALYDAGDAKAAGRASRLAIVFFDIEARAARTQEHSR